MARMAVALVVLVALVGAAVVPMAAALRLPVVIDSGMVLQREPLSAVLWGGSARE